MSWTPLGQANPLTRGPVRSNRAVMEAVPQNPESPAARRLPPLRSAWWVWAMAAPLYLVGFFHRVAPAVMTAELMRTFAIGATALGNLSAFYFYSYVLMQIPTGILADRWGPRRLLTAGARGQRALWQLGCLP